MPRGGHFAAMEQPDLLVDDVRSFFETFYVPNNAVLTLAGDIEPAHALEQVKRYFGEIEPGDEIPPLPGNPDIDPVIGSTVRDHAVSVGGVVVILSEMTLKTRISTTRRTSGSVKSLVSPVTCFLSSLVSNQFASSASALLYSRPDTSLGRHCLPSPAHRCRSLDETN